MVRVVGGILLAPSVAPPIPDCGAFITFLIRHLTLISLLEEGRINSPHASVSFNLITVVFPSKLALFSAILSFRL